MTQNSAENHTLEDIHLPVLCTSVLNELLLNRADLKARDHLHFADATLGIGGHSFSLLKADTRVKLTGIDRDEQALELARQRLADFEDRVEFQHSAFADVELPSQSLTGILADIGLSSLQLDTPERGFAFRFDAPLDMRMDISCGETAADLVNERSEQELADIFFKFGEEPRSRKIAAAIVQARKLAPIETTSQLARIIRQHAGRRPDNKQQKGRRKKPQIDPATRCFQALRIVVNDELGQLERALPVFLEALEDRGRLAIISFHSLEDRIVKNCFRDWKKAGYGKPLTKQPITADPNEAQQNPRSRSAKLRVFERQL